jgi:hypothetical protein
VRVHCERNKTCFRKTTDLALRASAVERLAVWLQRYVARIGIYSVCRVQKNNQRPLPKDLLFQKMSEVISLREQAQAELAVRMLRADPNGSAGKGKLARQQEPRGSIQSQTLAPSLIAPGRCRIQLSTSRSSERGPVGFVHRKVDRSRVDARDEPTGEQDCPLR